MKHASLRHLSFICAPKASAFTKWLPVLLGIASLSTLKAGDYNWTAAITANWDSNNWTPANPETTPIDPSVGPGAGDNIFFLLTGSRTTRLGNVDRSVNLLDYRGSGTQTAWTIEVGYANSSSTFTANEVRVSGSRGMQFRNGGAATANLSVVVGNLVLDGDPLSYFTFGGFPGAGLETHVHRLNALTVTGTTSLVQGSMYFNIGNANNNTFTLGVVNVTDGDIFLNRTYVAKDVIAVTKGLSGAGGKIHGSTFNDGDATLVIDNSTDFLSNTRIEDGAGGGTLSLIKQGEGVQTFTANHRYTGGTTIKEGVIQLGNGDTAGALQGDVILEAAGTELRFNRNTDSTLEGDITGLGSVSKQGSGAVVLSGDNDYSGGTQVNGGALLVANTSGSGTGTGGVNVAAGAKFGGSGIVTPDAGSHIEIDGALVSGLEGTGGITFDLSGSSRVKLADGVDIEFTLTSTSTGITFVSSGEWIEAAGDVNLVLTLGDDFSYSSTYVIFSGLSTEGFQFSNILGYDTLGYSHDFSKIGDEYHLSFVAVPEPGSVALVVLGGLGALAAYRRKQTSVA